MKKQKSWSLIKTERQNRYFYDRNVKRFQLCHPLLYYILKLSSEMDIGAIRNWLDNLPDCVEIEEYGSFSKEEIAYYFQKFLVLRENGYFSEIDQAERLSREVDAKTVEYNLANAMQITFEVTDRCNLSCAYCGYGKFYRNYDRRENKNLDARVAKRVLQHLAAFWNSPLNRSHDRIIHIGFYGGEPLLNFSAIVEIVEWLKTVKLLHNRFRFSMTSNGTLLKKHMDFLCANDFDLLISLDGGEENNAYRVFKNGRPAYNTILDNVCTLRKRYPDYFSARVNFNAVLHNKNSVADIYRFFKEQFGKTPLIGPLTTSGIKESQKKEFWKTYANFNQSLHESEDYSAIEKEMFFKLPNIQDVGRFLYNASEFCFLDYNHLMRSSREESKRTPTGTCTPFALKIFLTVNGKLLPCENIDHRFRLGQVTTDQLELNCEKIAQRYNDYYKKIVKQCSVCRNAELCGQCIFNLDSIEDENPVCSGFMNEADYSRHLSSYLNYFEAEPGAFFRTLKGGHIE